MRFIAKVLHGRQALTPDRVYMFLFSLRFHEAFWVIYLRSKGMSFAMIGMLETFFHLVSLFGEVPTGWIADRFGRKTSLVVGRVLSILAALLALRASTVAGFGFAFSFLALSYTCHSGAFDALVYDKLKTNGGVEDYTRVMGILNAVYLVGASTAALLGGLVAQQALAGLYILSVIVDLTAILFLIPLRESAFERDREERRRLDPLADLRGLLTCLRDARLVGLMLLWGCVSALETSIRFYGQSFMREAKISLVTIGAAGMLGNLAAIIPSTMAAKVERRFGSRIPLYIGSTLVPVSILLAGAVPRSGLVTQAVLVALILAGSVLVEGLYPLFSNAVNALTPSDRRATVLSSGSMLFSLIMMVLFPLIGACGDKIGLALSFVYTGGGALVLGGAFVGWSLIRTGRRVSQRLGR